MLVVVLYARANLRHRGIFLDFRLKLVDRYHLRIEVELFIGSEVKGHVQVEHLNYLRIGIACSDLPAWVAAILRKHHL